MSNGVSVKTGSAGVSTSGLLGVAFVVLKLTGYIDWDWIWVTAPFWVPLAFAIVVLVIFLTSVLIFGFLIPFVIDLFKSRRSKR